ncbi:Crp/Fnr family transcriptional regulator [Chryseobacterium defluvii]|nr:Crp/Fnr family transcriptional regulator [Chryseobacterium defluvii]
MKTVSCMNINEAILYSAGAEKKQYKKGDIIFRENDYALYYFQIAEGKVKLNNYNDEGKEFIHNILGKYQSFGDSLIFLNEQYPMNAIALTPVEIIRLSKNNFMELLKERPEISLEMNKCLAQKLYYKSLMIHNLASQNPVSRIKGLLDYLKSYHKEDAPYSYLVEITRQQLANLTGLRVETVIRFLKKMEKEGILKIENKKILY